MWLVRAAALLLIATTMLPVAAADIDFCTNDACVNEWHWNWGTGMCVQGDDQWWSWRVVRAGIHELGASHDVVVETFCYAYTDESGQGGFSSVHVELIETNETSGEHSWIWIDWYGSDSSAGSTCVMRVWSYGSETLPTGTIQEDCPARPPFVQSA